MKDILLPLIKTPVFILGLLINLAIVILWAEAFYAITPAIIVICLWFMLSANKLHKEVLLFFGAPLIISSVFLILGYLFIYHISPIQTIIKLLAHWGAEPPWN